MCATPGHLSGLLFVPSWERLKELLDREHLREQPLEDLERGLLDRIRVRPSRDCGVSQEKTRKSRACASRAVVSQHTGVEIPEMITVSIPRTRRISSRSVP